MKMPAFLRHPLGQLIVILVVAYILFEFGIAYIPPLLGMTSAPVPSTVVLQYMLTVVVGVLLWVSDNEERWKEFKTPIRRVMVEPEREALLQTFLVAVPILIAFVTYQQVKPSVAAPASIRAIHPAPPGQITFRGETIELSRLENPLRADGSITEDYEEGKRIYYQNCLACHGDALDGQGHYALGFNPTPLSFQDNGTIAQLTESFVFWRIAKGGPGLPKEGAPWNSAMPAWEDFLTKEEIWAVTIFIYEQSGWTPRTLEQHGESEGEGEH